MREVFSRTYFKWFLLTNKPRVFLRVFRAKAGTDFLQSKKERSAKPRANLAGFGEESKKLLGFVACGKRLIYNVLHAHTGKSRLFFTSTKRLMQAVLLMITLNCNPL